MSATLVEWLLRAADRPDAGLRFVDRRERATFVGWPEVLERAAAVAGGLRALGVRRGERVALVFPTGPEFFDAFFGALLAGGVPVALYPPVRLGRLDEYHRRTGTMIAGAEAAVVLADRRVARLLGKSVSRGRPRLGLRRLGDLPPGPTTPVEPGPDDLALVQFSSGTTRRPEGVALSHRAVTAQVEILNRFWPDGEGTDHSGVSWLPLYHDMGLIGCVFPALERPAVLTLLPPEAFLARPALWLRAVSRYRATISPAPSFAYALSVERIRDEEVEGCDLSCWRVALCGAETVVPDVLRSFAGRFGEVGFSPRALTPVYGLSEAALAVTFGLLDGEWRSRRLDRDALAAGRVVDDEEGREVVSVGGPIPSFDLEVRDDDGRPLPEEAVGRVWVRGPSLMTGYLGRPERTAEVLVDGWLDTGDLGFVDEGELFLVGRAKDVIIVRGRNHHPDELETAVSSLPGVRSGCVVAASAESGAGGREEVVLFVERGRGTGDEELAGIEERCREAALAAAGIAVDRVVVVAPGTIPRTSSGKLRRRETVRRWRAGELRPPAPVTPIRLAGELLGSRWAAFRSQLDESDGRER